MHSLKPFSFLAFILRTLASGLLCAGGVFSPVVFAQSSVEPLSAFVEQKNFSDSDSVALMLLTEQNEPYNYLNPKTGMLDGSGVILLRKIMKLAGVPYSMRLLPWRRAYRQAMNAANTCVFVTNRTPSREALFQWVGPVTESKGGWVFYKRPESDIVINSIEDVMRYIVVGRIGSAPLAEFKKQTGAKILESPTGEGAVELLFHGRADLWLSGAQDGPITAKLAGMPSPKHAFGWRDYGLYLACQKNMNPALVKRLNEINETLRDLRISLSKKALTPPSEEER